MLKRIFTWNSPAVVFAVVFCLVLTTATLVTRALYAKGPSGPSPVAEKFIANWPDYASVGQTSGNRGAPVTIVVFADYQCPGCALLHKELAAAADSMPGALRIVTRHYPLSAHAHAKAAANAAECAAEQGRFREFENRLYGQQDSIGQKTWMSFAGEAGVRDSADFARCVNRQRYAFVVDRDLKVARTLKLEGTPVYLVNGNSHFGAPSGSELLVQLRQAASASSSAANDTNLVVTSSVGATTSNAAPGTVPERRWLAPLTLERTITGAAHDELLNPANLTVSSNNQLVFFDLGNMEVRAFNREGIQLWRSGRKGAGPGEFRNAMDVKVRGNGEIAVLDMGNRRITALSATGRALRTIPLRLSAHRLVPFADTTFYALAADDSSSLWHSISTLGDTTRRILAPATLVAHQAIEREAFTAALGRNAVVAYRWSSKFAIVGANGSVERIIEGVEPVAFPGIKAYPLKSGKFKGFVSRISPAATAAALSVATGADKIFVLFAGATANRGRIVDIYESSSGAYVGSRLLPFPALELVVLPEGGFATLRAEPVPSIDIWRDER